MHTCFSLTGSCSPLTPLVSDTFEAIDTRSLVITTNHSIMIQVLTGEFSSRAHRMWSDSNSSSSGRGGALQDAAAHQPRAACAV